MKNLLLRISLFLVLAISVCNFASGAGIAVTLTGVTIDTFDVTFGYTLTVNAKVRNTDSSHAFSGELDFGARNNANFLSATNLFGKPPYSGNQITLNPGESVPAVFSVHIEQPYFMVGPDVVVVWPIVPAPVDDSVVIHLVIEDPSGIKEQQQNDFTYFVMSDKILLHYLNNETNFKQVRIFDILGQVVSQFHSDFITEIPVPNLPRGIYLCEMIAADKKSRVVKFLH